VLYEIAVMGAEGAVDILYNREIESSENPETERENRISDYREKFNNPYFAARAGYVDDIIEPRNTRFRVIRALKTLSQKKLKNPPRNMEIYLYNILSYDYK